MTTRSGLRDDLRLLGVKAGDLLMVHASMRQVGAITGGVNVLIQAMFDVIGPEGTVTAYIDFEPFYGEETNPAEIPVFDKRIAHAARDHGILHEVLRTWPGALRSDHPDAGVVAIGRRADWITASHPFQYGYGPGTPFARILEANGQVLMIGAPLDTITLLHHAEHLARIPDKRIHRYRRLMPGGTEPVWTEFEEFDTREPVSPRLPENCFEIIAQEFLNSGRGAQGKIGGAVSYLFNAPELVPFAVQWLEQRAG